MIQENECDPPAYTRAREEELENMQREALLLDSAAEAQDLLEGGDAADSTGREAMKVDRKSLPTRLCRITVGRL